MKKILSVGILALSATIASANANVNPNVTLSVSSLNVNKNSTTLKSVTDYSLTAGAKNLYINGWVDNISTNDIAGGLATIDYDSWGANIVGKFNIISLNLGYQYEKAKLHYNGDTYSTDINFYSGLVGTNINNFDFKIGGVFGDKSDTNIYLAKATYTIAIQNNLQLIPSIWLEKNDKGIGNGETENKTNVNGSLSVKYTTGKATFVVGGKAGWEKASITNTVKVLPAYEEGNSGFLNVNYQVNKELNIGVGLKVGNINGIDKDTLESKKETATTLKANIAYSF